MLVVLIFKIEYRLETHTKKIDIFLLNTKYKFNTVL